MSTNTRVLVGKHWKRIPLNNLVINNLSYALLQVQQGKVLPNDIEKLRNIILKGEK